MVLTAQQRVKNLKMFYLGPKLLKKIEICNTKKKSSICNGALTPNLSYSPSTEI